MISTGQVGTQVIIIIVFKNCNNNNNNNNNWCCHHGKCPRLSKNDVRKIYAVFTPSLPPISLLLTAFDSALPHLVVPPNIHVDLANGLKTAACDSLNSDNKGQHILTGSWFAEEEGGGRFFHRENSVDSCVFGLSDASTLIATSHCKDETRKLMWYQPIRSIAVGCSSRADTFCQSQIITCRQ